MHPTDSSVLVTTDAATNALPYAFNGRRAARALLQSRTVNVHPGRVLPAVKPAPELKGVPGAFGRPRGVLPPATLARHRALAA